MEQKLTDLTDEELYKSFYEYIALSEQATMNVRLINEEIAKRRKVGQPTIVKKGRP